MRRLRSNRRTTNRQKTVERLQGDLYLQTSITTPLAK